MARKKQVVEEATKVEEVKTNKPTIADFDVIIEPVITEKSMTASENQGKFTFKVRKGAGKTQIRKAIEKIYGVHVTGISTVNVHSKNASRGSRYKGTISGYKKAIVTLKDGETINLFAE